jgi:hypothetical protein
MTVPELLRDLADPGPGVPGVYLLVTRDGSLEYHPHAPGAALTEAQRAFIRAHKAKIARWLRAPAESLTPADLAPLDYAPGAARLHPPRKHGSHVP